MNIKFKKSDGTVVPGQVTLQDEADENEDLVAVKIKLAEKTYEARAESYFASRSCVMGQREMYIRRQ